MYGMLNCFLSFIIKLIIYLDIDQVGQEFNNVRREKQWKRCECPDKFNIKQMCGYNQNTASM